MKKIIIFMLCLCLLSCVTAFAEPVEGGDISQGEVPEVTAPQEGFGGRMPRGERPQMPEGFNHGEMPQMPEGFNPGEMPQMPEGFNQGERGQRPGGGFTRGERNTEQNEATGENGAEHATPNEQSPEQKAENNKGQRGENGGFPMMGEGGFRGGMQGQNMREETQPKGFMETYFTPVISLVLLLVAFIFVIFYKRKHF